MKKDASILQVVFMLLCLVGALCLAYWGESVKRRWHAEEVIRQLEAKSNSK